MEAIAAIFSTATVASAGKVALTAASTVPVAGPAGGAAAAAAGGSSFFSGLTLGDALLGGFGIASGLSAISSGQLQAGALEAEAEFEDLAARRELSKAKEVAVREKQALNKTLAANLAATGAAGLALEGSPVRTLESNIADAEFEIGLAGDRGATNAAVRRSNVRTLRSDAGVARRSGFADAIVNSFFLAATARR